MCPAIRTRTSRSSARRGKVLIKTGTRAQALKSLLQFYLIMRRSFRSSPDEYSEKDLYELEEKIGVRFKNQVLLVAAVTRRAYAKELRDKQPNIVREYNERLEFLGDGALELAVRKSLYDKHEDQEGDLSKMADGLVNESNLTRIAEDLALKEHLFLTKGEESDEKGKPSILAGALEAIIGAVYLDQGLKETIEVVERLILCRRA